MTQHDIRTDGYYRTGVREIVSYEGEERKAEEVYVYYLFLPNGIWVSKTVPAPNFDFKGFLESLGLDLEFLNPEDDEPLLSDGDLVYQCGWYEREGDGIRFRWQHSALEDGEHRWLLRITEQGDLSDAAGDYVLRFLL